MRVTILLLVVVISASCSPARTHVLRAGHHPELRAVELLPVVTVPPEAPWCIAVAAVNNGRGCFVLAIHRGGVRNLRTTLWQDGEVVAPDVLSLETGISPANIIHLLSGSVFFSRVDPNMGGYFWLEGLYALDVRLEPLPPRAPRDSVPLSGSRLMLVVDGFPRAPAFFTADDILRVELGPAPHNWSRALADLARRGAQALAHSDLDLAISRILPHLTSPAKHVRLHAAAAMGAVGLAEHAPALLPLLDDPSADVAYEALVALGRIGTQGELPALRAWHERVSAADALLSEPRRRLDAKMSQAYASAVEHIALRPSPAHSTMPQSPPDVQSDPGPPAQRGRSDSRRSMPSSRPIAPSLTGVELLNVLTLPREGPHLIPAAIANNTSDPVFVPVDESGLPRVSVTLWRNGQAVARSTEGLDGEAPHCFREVPPGDAWLTQVPLRGHGVLDGMYTLEWSVPVSDAESAGSSWTVAGPKVMLLVGEAASQ
jgi:hypothetical protein